MEKNFLATQYKKINRRNIIGDIHVFQNVHQEKIKEEMHKKVCHSHSQRHSVMSNSKKTNSTSSRLGSPRSNAPKTKAINLNKRSSINTADEHNPYDEIQNEKLIEEVAKTMSKPPNTNTNIDYVSNQFKADQDREMLIQQDSLKKF